MDPVMSGHAGSSTTQWRLVGDELHVRPVVGADRADVAPVAVHAVLERPAVSDQVGDEDIAVVPGRSVVGQGVEPAEQVTGVEHEHLGAHPITRRLVRLVLEAGDDAVGDLDPGEARLIVVGWWVGGDHGDGGPVGAVAVDGVAQVELEQMVRAQRDDHLGGELGQQVAVLHEGVGVARGHDLVAVTALERRQDAQPTVGAVEIPWPAVGEVVVEIVGFELLQDPYIVELAVGHVGQGHVDQAVHPGERQRRLGALTGQRAEAPARAAGQHDHQHPSPPSPRRRRHRGLGAGGRAHPRCVPLAARNRSASPALASGP